MKPLTKREKLLLYALAVIAIVAGMMLLVIQPAMKRTEELDAAVMERQLSLDGIRASMITSNTLQEQIDESEAGVVSESRYFLPLMTNNELDEYITGLLQTHGLTALSLAISAAEDASLTADASSGSLPANSGEIRTYVVQTTARGTMTQFRLLLDTVAELDGVRISALTNKQEPTEKPKVTPTPKPAKKTKAKAKATPTPLYIPPTPTPREDTYTMQITFCVQEYIDGTSTSVTLDRGE